EETGAVKILMARKCEAELPPGASFTGPQNSTPFFAFLLGSALFVSRIGSMSIIVLNQIDNHHSIHRHLFTHNIDQPLY
ncbi:MAG TPA: hypothetical protein VHD63_03760, partial [Ktedonobacteraceae bacterium]|nr:hypothetical protein [Ktedonobacteraceae bacterium]